MDNYEEILQELREESAMNYLTLHMDLIVMEIQEQHSHRRLLPICQM